jgi:hypothetical protein
MEFRSVSSGTQRKLARAGPVIIQEARSDEATEYLDAVYIGGFDPKFARHG